MKNISFHGVCRMHVMCVPVCSRPNVCACVIKDVLWSAEKRGGGPPNEEKYCATSTRMLMHVHASAEKRGGGPPNEEKYCATSTHIVLRNTTLLTFDTYANLNDVIAFDVARQQCFKIMTLIAKLYEIRPF